MSTIYLTNHGKLRKQGKTLRFYQLDETVSILHPFKIEQLILMGNIEVTAGALKLLMHHRIDTIFLNKNGRFNGKLIFEEGKNVFLRQKQYHMLDRGIWQLNFAKDVVRGKLKNQLTFMNRIRRERKLSAIDATITMMKSNIVHLELAETLQQLRGYEGVGSKYFFSVYKKSIIQDWAIFNGRSMNPPKDNVNSVLSFLYTLLNYRVESAIAIEGLDSYVGYLHTLDYGRKSLTFDLMEEFRTPIVDTLSSALFNLGILNKNDFESVDFSAQNDDYPLEVGGDSDNTPVIESKRGVLLKRDSLKKVITHFEKKLNSEIFYQQSGKKLNYKQLIREQVKHFKRFLNGDEQKYKPLLIK